MTRSLEWSLWPHFLDPSVKQYRIFLYSPWRYQEFLTVRHDVPTSASLNAKQPSRLTNIGRCTWRDRCREHGRRPSREEEFPRVAPPSRPRTSRDGDSQGRCASRCFGQIDFLHP